MGYSLLQISEILLKADKTTYRLGTVAYENMFSEDSEDVDFERDIIYIYKKAVEYADDFHVGTTKLDQVVERLANRLVIYNYGQLNPIYSDSVISNPVLPTGSVLNDLNDVTITNVQDNQILRYSSSLGQWINVGPNASIRSSQAFTATLNQTVFVTTSPFNASLLDVYLNGVRLNTSSYSTFGSHTITLYDGCLADDILDVTIYDPEADILDISGYVRNTRTLTINGVTQDLSADRTWNVDTLYNANGTLTGNRTVNSGGFSLTLNPDLYLSGTKRGVSTRTYYTPIRFSTGTWDTFTLNAGEFYENFMVTDASTSISNTGVFINNAIIKDGTYNNNFGQTGLNSSITFAVTHPTNSSVAATGIIAGVTRGWYNDISTNSNTTMTGASFFLQNNGFTNANIATSSAITVRAFQQIISGTIVNDYGYFDQKLIGRSSTSRGVTVTNAYGLYSEVDVGWSSGLGGIITNYYAIYINAIVRATGTISNRWGIYAPDALSAHYFSGNVLLGTTADSGLAKLQVNGPVQQSAVLSSLLKTDSSGVLVAATPGVDYANSNIYTADGTLTGNRIVTVGGNQLVFSTDQYNLQPYTYTIGTPTGAPVLTLNSSVIFEGEYMMDSASAAPFNTRVWGRNQSASSRSFTVNRAFADVTSESTSSTSIDNQVFVTRRGSQLDTSTALSNVYGVNSTAGHAYLTTQNSTTANINSAFVVPYASNIQNYGGNITNAIHFYARSFVSNFTSTRNSTITNHYSFYSDAFVGTTSGGPTAAITNYYGIYLAAPTLGATGTISNRWGIYAPDAVMDHYFNGNVLLGTATDTGLYKLDVNGGARVSGETTIDNNLYITGSGSVRTIFVTAYTAGLRLSASSSIGNFDLFKGLGYAQISSINESIRYSSPSHLFGGTTYVSSALVNIDSTTQGFLPPRMITTDKTSIVSPVAGLIVYDNTLNALTVYNGTSWVSLGAGGGGSGVPYTGATANVDLGEYELKAGQITLDTTPTGTAAVGTTRWNDTFGGSETTLKGGSVVLKNGVDLVARVVNKVTPNATLTKAAYQAVRVSGAQGQRLAVAYAQANSDPNSADTLGLVCETIATNQEGFIMAMGQLENINTTGSLQGETWADGDVLYLSPTTPGAITKVKPTGAGHIVVIGYVEYAHVNNGKIYVKVMNGWELDELHDVDIVTPANNQALIYESSTALWKNKTIATALGYTPLSGSGVAGQVAYWNGTNSQTGSNDLFWDAANARLGIGANVPNRELHIAKDKPADGVDVLINNTSSSIKESTQSRIRLVVGNNVADGNWVTFGVTQNGSSFSGNAFFWNEKNSSFMFATNNGEKMRLWNTGNLLLQNGGTFTDGGQRLQVYGDAFIKGSGATNATNALQIQNSASTDLFVVRNDGSGFLKKVGNSSGFYLDTNGESIKGGASGNLSLGFGAGSYRGFFQFGQNHDNGNGDNWYFGYSSTTFSNISTSGSNNFIGIQGNFRPTSGTASYSQLSIYPTINQTGGANGITRGLYVNPTITAAADWRAIETTAGNVIFNGGNVGIGANTAAAKLHISTSSIGITQSDANGLLLKNETAATALLNQNSPAIVLSGNGWKSNAPAQSVESSWRISSTPVTGSTNVEHRLTFEVGSNTTGSYFSTGFYVYVDRFSNTTVYTNTLNTQNITGLTSLSIGKTNPFNVNEQLIISGQLSVTSGSYSGISNSAGINPTSGNLSYSGYGYFGTINQTGGANGITRGLYVNPTLTAAADWRSIETSNNTGWSYYGGGTANSYFGGRVGIGTNTPLDFNLVVQGALQVRSSANSFLGLLIENNTIKRRDTGTFSLGSNDVATAIHIYASNNVGLSTSSDAGFKLDVNGTARVSGQASFGQSIAYSAGIKLSGALANNSPSLFIAQWNSVGDGFDYTLNDNGILRLRYVNSGVANANELMSFSRTGVLDINQNTTFFVPATIYQSAFSSIRYRLRNLPNYFVGYDSSDETVKLAVENDANPRYVSLGGSTTNGTVFNPVLTVRPNTGSVAIGVLSANASSVLEVASTTKGFLPPRMTATQLAAISTPAVGLVAYQTDGTEGLYQYKSTGWTLVAGSGGSTAYSVTSVTTTYSETATSGTKIVKADTTGGAFTVSLPTAVGNTATIIIKKSAGTASLTIDAAGTETIDGGLTATINKVYESITLISDNANWQIV